MNKKFYNEIKEVTDVRVALIGKNLIFYPDNIVTIDRLWEAMEAVNGGSWFDVLRELDISLPDREFPLVETFLKKIEQDRDNEIDRPKPVAKPLDERQAKIDDAVTRFKVYKAKKGEPVKEKYPPFIKYPDDEDNGGYPIFNIPNKLGEYLMDSPLDLKEYNGQDKDCVVEHKDTGNNYKIPVHNLTTGLRNNRNYTPRDKFIVNE